MIVLKPCPFCGTSVNALSPDTVQHPIAHCCMTGRSFYTEFWNRRATPDNDVIQENPDWYYRDQDPDNSGDSAYEAMWDNAPELVPDMLHTSYHGPTKWGVLCPEMPGAKEDGSTVHEFNTKEEAQEFCDERKTAISAFATE